MHRVCFICRRETELTSEHIIPQCLGGVLTAPLYCAECNGACGHEIDIELANHFGRYATLLCIRREHGDNQPFEIHVEESGLRLRCDGRSLFRVRPEVRIEKDSDGTLTEAEIIARSERELRTIFKGIGRRYNIEPNIGAIEPEANPAPTAAYHEFVIDNELIRRAVAKIAYGFACVRLPADSVLAEEFNAVRNFIRGRFAARIASANYVAGDFMVDNHRPLHKIHLRLERKNQILVGYVALFGTFRYTVLLAEGLRTDVEWPGIDYTYNPVTQQEVLGNDNFLAPSIGRECVIAPRNSQQQVLQALERGQNMIAEHSPAIEAVRVEEIGA